MIAGCERDASVASVAKNRKRKQDWKRHEQVTRTCPSVLSTLPDFLCCKTGGCSASTQTSKPCLQYALHRRVQYVCIQYAKKVRVHGCTSENTMKTLVYITSFTHF